jgi:hypothetical protein
MRRLIASGWCAIGGALCPTRPTARSTRDGLHFSVRGEPWTYHERALSWS